MKYFGDSRQEEFVLNINKFKTEGYYVELGAFHSRIGSNTYHLEKDFNWKGVSFEIEESRRTEFCFNRINPCLGDALDYDYMSYFKENNFPKQIDFLQVDIDGGYDPAQRPFGNHYTSLLGLISVPLNKYRFTVITFEHDTNMYFRNSAMRDAQREILDCLGYTLLVKEIHEDWWVDPTVVDIDHYANFRGFN